MLFLCLLLSLPLPLQFAVKAARAVPIKNGLNGKIF